MQNTSLSYYSCYFYRYQQLNFPEYLLSSACLITGYLLPTTALPIPGGVLAAQTLQASLCGGPQDNPTNPHWLLGSRWLWYSEVCSSKATDGYICSTSEPPCFSLPCYCCTRFLFNLCCTIFFWWKYYYSCSCQSPPLQSQNKTPNEGILLLP